MKNFSLALVVAVSIIIGYVCSSKNSQPVDSDPITIANIEALTLDSEGSSDSGAPKCTGPKENGECKCTNGYSCRDNSGC